MKFVRRFSRRNLNGLDHCAWCNIILDRIDGVPNYPINSYLICTPCWVRIGPEGDEQE
jgi:hypothetical protein